MAPRPKSSKPVEVESIHHQDRRVNIPTEELRDFVAADEGDPEVMLYPRDPSLDPQLVWKGKDEQDRQDLAVPVVPIYIQEKIHPQAIIDNLRCANHRTDSAQLDLFADFNGLSDNFDQKIEFYQHEQHWSNRMILGDSLMVMTSLAEKEGLKGKVQTIYLDPPYGIKFGSNWQVSTRKRDVKDGSVTDATRQPEQVKAFRDTWQLGIHSYLAYLRDRFVVARDLMTESGSIFVQIGDENVHLMRAVMDEVFGAENYIAQITYRVKSPLAKDALGRVSDFIVWYAKNREEAKIKKLFVEQDRERQSEFNMIEIQGEKLSVSRAIARSLDPNQGRYLTAQNLASSGFTASCTYTYSLGPKQYPPPKGHSWKTTEAGMRRLEVAGRLVPLASSLRFAYYFEDFPWTGLNDVWMDTYGEAQREYVVQTSTEVIRRCLLMTTDPGDLVLDPTCGSGTTAYVAEQWGRRWITIDTSRVALALARTRLMAAKFPFYYLADSLEGIQKEAQLTGLQPPDYPAQGDIRKGFVYKRVPHVTLKSIANNPDIREGMTRQAIDHAIARYAETETLYDQPYEDTKRVRVSGPFTVESLSPHRVLATADDDHDGKVSPDESGRQGDFATMILDNLRKSGVQNGFKGERLTFDRLEPYPGAWINATGDYTDADGKSHRVAVSIGPEHGTVAPSQIKEAAKEAVQGIGFDILIICGFAFDAHVSEEAKRYGTLTVLPTKMNPDLALGDDLLKKTGAGNLFMVFGEPDIVIDRVPDGQIKVTIHGVDVYDPTTGVVQTSSTDDIACWFIDTNYNGESFFVRHAYFTGADEPFTKLQRALRAEIDEDAWASLYRTESRPFDTPETGKIAIKVINHYGDEVMKVYNV